MKANTVSVVYDSDESVHSVIQCKKGNRTPKWFTNWINECESKGRTVVTYRNVPSHALAIPGIFSTARRVVINGLN